MRLLRFIGRSQLWAIASRAGLVCLLAFTSGAGCDTDGHAEPFDADGSADAGDGADDEAGTGGRFGFPNDGPSDGQGPMGNPQYQPNFIERGRPPGPPARGYTAVEAELSGSGEGQLCAQCADSSDCSEGACVIQMDTGEMFCASECESDLDCPDPQAQECVSAEGATAAQCVPRLGTCYEFDPGATPINPINEPPDDLGEGGAAGSSGE